MVISMDEYTSLRREFLKVAKFHINSTALEELKDCYKEAIKSERALDRIDDVEGLLRILEKRGVVRYNLVTPLKHIARKYISGSVINALLDDYEARVKSQGPSYPDKTNLYQFGNVHYIPAPSAPSSSGSIEAPSNQYPGFITRFNATQPACNVTHPPVTSSSLQKLSPKEAQIQKLVFERVSCEVGGKWREVARRLEVRENFIDQIQAQQHLTIPEKALHIFYKFAEDTDLKQWRWTLMRALEDARRKDLRELVAKLLSREY